jgi:HAMP domain-containing protein
MARITRVFGVPKLRVEFMRGLRFRLTLTYVLFFAVLLVAIGLLFRKNLQLELDGDVRALLEEEWGSAKGYLRIENQRPIWIADPTDPEENYIVSRLKHVFLLTDADGNVLDDSETYESIGVDSLDEIRRIMRLPQPEVHIRNDKDGVPYIIKAGTIPGDRGHLYFFAIGRSLSDSRKAVAQLTRNYFLLLPGMLTLASLLGWVVAGRAIQPLNSVAQAAQNITGSNLSLQIPLRGAGDELDHLIDSFNRMTLRLNIASMSLSIYRDRRIPKALRRAVVNLDVAAPVVDERQRPFCADRPH